MMVETAVIYKSKYGSTKKYAQWIAESLNAELFEESEVSAEKLLEYNTIIYGGGLYASGISGISVITKNFDLIKDKNIIVFTVGLNTTEDISIFEPIIKKNIPDYMRNSIKFFHLRGGMDYSKLNFMHKTMMGMMKKAVEKKEIKTDEDMHMLETYGGIVDFKDPKTIEPLITYVNGL
ncbi:MAG: flavodoxin domain-containing protein [Solirubrobacterales bacterium]